MSVFQTMNISSSGLTAQRLRMDTIANNLANINTTSALDGTPFKRQLTLFQSAPFYAGKGVRVTGVIEDPSPGRLRYEPGHPDARDDGFVEYPNIDPVVEMVDMISATRSYEANVACINASKLMAQKALDIARA